MDTDQLSESPRRAETPTAVSVSEPRQPSPDPLSATSTSTSLRSSTNTDFSSRRQSSEIEQRLPRKRVAMEVAITDSEGQMVTEVQYDDGVVVSDPDDDREPSGSDNDIPTESTFSMDAIHVQENSLEAESVPELSDELSSVTDVITTVERIIIAEVTHTLPDENQYTIESFLLEGQRALRSENPNVWVQVFTQHAEKFVNMDESGRFELWGNTKTFFDHLPNLALDLWNRSDPIPQKCWRDEGDQSIIAFFTSFMKIAAYSLGLDICRLQLDKSAQIQLFSVPYIAAVVTMLRTIDTSIATTCAKVNSDCYTSFTNLSQIFMESGGIEGMKDFWTELTSSTALSSSNILIALLPCLELSSILACVLNEQAGRADADSTDSSSTSLESQSEDSSPKSKLHSLSKLKKYLLLVDETISNYIDSPNAPERKPLLGAIDKSQMMFYVLMRHPELELEKSHPAMSLLIKSLDEQEIEDLRLISFAIRKAYWFIRLFKSSRRDFKFAGIKMINNDLQRLYKESNQRQSVVIVQNYGLLMSATGFTEFLVSSEANRIIIAQFAGTIYSYLALFNVITEKELEILWNEMKSCNTPSLYEALATVFIEVSNWMSESWLNWIIDKLLTLPLVMAEPVILKLIDTIIGAYIILAKRGESHAHGAISINPFIILLQVMKRVSNISAEEENSMKVKPISFLDTLVRNFDELMRAWSKTSTLQELLETHVIALERFGSDSLQDLIYIRAYVESPEWADSDANSEPLKMLLDRYSYQAIFVENTKAWSNYCDTSNQSAELYSFSALLRQDCLIKLITLAPASISSSDTLEVLWQALYTNPHNTTDIQNAFWQHLFVLASGVTEQCYLLDFCFSKIKSLRLENFSTCVNFIVAYFGYEFRCMDKNAFISEENGYLMSGFDTFWNFYLSTPNEECTTQCLDFLVRLLIESEYITSQPRELIERCHRSLIRLCMNTIKEALKGMIYPYRRTLKFMDSFLDAYRQYALYSVSTLNPNLGQVELKGTTIVIKTQWEPSKTAPNIETLTIGNLNLVEELFSVVSTIITTSSFRIIVMGREITTNDGHKTLKDAGFRDITPIIVLNRSHPAPCTDVETSTSNQTEQHASQSIGPQQESDQNQPLSDNFLRPAEHELMDSSDILLDLLQLDDDHALYSLNILKKLGPAPKLLDLFMAPESVGKHWKDCFPLQKPFRTLYSSFVLEHVYSQSQQKNVGEQWAEKWLLQCWTFILPSILHLVVEPRLCSLSIPEVQERVRATLLRLCVSMLRDNASTQIADSILPDSDVIFFVRRLAELTEQAQKELCKCILDLLVTLSTRDTRIWTTVEQNPKWKEIFCKYLLSTDDESIRVYFAKKISDFVKQRLDDSSTSELKYFWNIVLEILPGPNEVIATQSSALFTLAEFVLKSVLNHRSIEFDEQALCIMWYNSLKRHTPTETLLSSSIDNFVDGYVRLIICTLEFLHTKSEDPDFGEDCPEHILRLLFPKLVFSDDDDFETGTEIKEEIGCTTADSRGSLYKLLTLLTTETAARNDVISKILLLSINECIQEESWSVDRNQWIRVEAGYVGLQNLANTCYLNSFMNQLYMNKEFRNNVFGLPLPPRAFDNSNDDSNSENSHALANNLIRLFAYLRYSWHKMINTTAFIQSILDFENKPIDISIQMDVDEFYNLLFDRLEGQIDVAERKEAIKKCYGGMLLTQIKSKECEHVSETQEPFSAIQCDIKGKRNLTESLVSYVEGETLEGENKYKCSSCGTHVDAERRMCLKEVPDHLIFHLKRFDYDFQSMERNKINDLFEFPAEIDMAPYKLVNLNDKSNTDTDKFHLVGILVHNGTAESGHYYSYIRNDDAMDEKYKWVEFNDGDVTPFDPNQIGDMCFGGLSAELAMEKHYSAYMLFYDRDKPNADEMDTDVVLTNAPEPLRHQICSENEQLTLKWTMFGAEHTSFVLDMYQQSWKEQEQDTEKPLYEDYHALMFSTLYHVVCRNRNGKEELEKYLLAMQESFTGNVRHSMAFLAWLATHDDALCGLVVGCPNISVSKSISCLIRDCLKTVKDEAPEEYGSIKEWLACLREPNSHQNVCFSFLYKLGEIIPMMNASSLAWDDYFELMADISGYGSDESAIFVYSGFLHKALAAFYNGRVSHKAAVLVSDGGPFFREVRQPRRRHSFTGILTFIMHMVQRVDFSLEMSGSAEERCSGELGDDESLMRMPPLDVEVDLLSRRPRNNILAFYYQQLENAVPMDLVMDFVEVFSQCERAHQYAFADIRLIFSTIIHGLDVDMVENVFPFLLFLLRLVIYYGLAYRDCEQISNSVFRSLDMTSRAAGVAYSEYLSLVANSADVPEALRRATMTQIPVWAPSLLVHYQGSVRLATQQQVNVLLFERIAACDEEIEEIGAVGASSATRGEHVNDQEELAREVPAEQLARLQRRRVACVHVVLRLVGEIFAYVERTYGRGRRASTDELRFEVLDQVLETCARAANDAVTTARIEDLRQELDVLQTQSAGEWTAGWIYKGVMLTPAGLEMSSEEGEGSEEAGSYAGESEEERGQ
ncbi:uncharacterized protein V1518DRAFT_369045 [Limtongia smithiae]|uniref:uncharacterized protein n=1 Tax=Limtongia smithiae TaxID=1125753 RepID=UPI0034CDE93C